MKLNELKNITGTKKKRKRVGRGIGSGIGKTCGRGQKGQKSRSGVSLNGYEGGQNPIHMRLPKRGFKNIFSRKIVLINLYRIQELLDKGVLDSSKIISLFTLQEAGVVSRRIKYLKLLGKGELKMPINVEVSYASLSARKAILDNKGKLTLLDKD